MTIEEKIRKAAECGDRAEFAALALRVGGLERARAIVRTGPVIRPCPAPMLRGPAPVRVLRGVA